VPAAARANTRRSPARQLRCRAPDRARQLPRDWRRAPEQYGAIHFHDDDLEDAGWEPDFALTLPDGTGATTLLSVPGLGALRASCANGVATTQWQNTSSGSVTVVNQVVLHKTGAPAAGDSDVNVASVAGGATVDQPTNSGLSGQESVMWQASDDSSGGDRVSTMWVTAGASGTSCRITAQGFATATP